jgi:hypothetical protein
LPDIAANHCIPVPFSSPANVSRRAPKSPITKAKNLLFAILSTTYLKFSTRPVRPNSTLSQKGVLHFTRETPFNVSTKDPTFMENNLTETQPAPAPKNRGPRPFNVTPEHRNHVKLLACLGITQDEIAKSLGLTVPTLRKFFYHEMYLTTIDAGTSVLSSLFEMAAARHEGAAALVWAKTRHGYRPSIAQRQRALQPAMTQQSPPVIWRTIRRKLRIKNADV